MEKKCKNCKHVDVEGFDEPCRNCSVFDHTLWEPTTDLTGGMTVREMLQRLRVNTVIEIRVDNYEAVRIESDHINYVKEELLSEEVYDWGLSNGTIFINVKRK